MKLQKSLILWKSLVLALLSALSAPSQLHLALLLPTSPSIQEKSFAAVSDPGVPHPWNCPRWAIGKRLPEQTSGKRANFSAEVDLLPHWGKFLLHQK